MEVPLRLPDPNAPWYHGSPLHLSTLRPGSTITQDLRLARIFSHKPGLVSVADDGSIRHNGRQPGFLYMVNEPILPEEVIPVPHSTMEPGWEWLTHREQQLRLLEITQIQPEELILPKEVEFLLRKAGI